MKVDPKGKSKEEKGGVRYREEAARAYDQAAYGMRGPLAILNFPKDYQNVASSACSSSVDVPEGHQNVASPPPCSSSMFENTERTRDAHERQVLNLSAWMIKIAIYPIGHSDSSGFTVSSYFQKALRTKFPGYIESHPKRS
ncbi:hypothetical protein CK203_008846 [Vitis vinifera]|uniref:AP2/ERF domain-containing protein n=1 Tax=Vitis vinifera TaxID=29760 RepID=A0A438KDZ2_VITVI|nr:hypothetical protein CK203_008846 [Vitis vinifera]